MTVEDIIRDREKLTGQTWAACGTEMEKLGFIVDSLQIHEMEDPTGCIQKLAAPHAATVQRDARIALAEADPRATEAEQQSFARMAEATRNSEILQAGTRPSATRGSRRRRPRRRRRLAENQEAVVAQQLAENWPEIVRAGASAFGNVDNLVLPTAPTAWRTCSPRRSPWAVRGWGRRVSCSR